MKTREIVEALIIRATSLFSDEVRTDQGFWESQLAKCRASVISEIYRKEKRIHDSWVQWYRPVFDSNMQSDDCFVAFSVYPAIKLETTNDGYRYIGSKTQNYALRRIVSRGQLATYNQHRITKVTSRKPAVLIEDGLLKVYGNPDLQEIEVGLIAANPLEIPTFNKEYDDYPISVELLPIIEERIFKGEALNIFNKVPDTVSNSSDTPQIQPSR